MEGRNMKELDLHGISFMRPVREGTSEWYYAMDYDNGDIYEAQEIFEHNGHVDGNRLYLIHYPDAEVIEPLASSSNVAIGEPVFYQNKISFISVDFAKECIRIHSFDCEKKDLQKLDEIPLSSVKSCLNLRLFEHPLTLTRQGNDGTLDLVWPEQRTIKIGERESFFYLEDSKLYFNRWDEDPSYREETVIRDKETGELTEVFPGDIHIMPNGEIWHLY